MSITGILPVAGIRTSDSQLIVIAGVAEPELIFKIIFYCP